VAVRAKTGETRRPSFTERRSVIAVCLKNFPVAWFSRIEHIRSYILVVSILEPT
jgi:hypothetical protein